MGIFRGRGRRGSALLAVLWLSAALAAIALSLANTVRGETERTSTEVEGARAYYLATGAIRRTTLRMIWAWERPNLPANFKTTGKTTDLQQFPTGQVEVEIIPEAAKLNINQARPAEIFALLINLGVEPDRAQTITAGIVDWRSPSPGGALTEFDQYYLASRSSFQARHASMEEIEELLLIRGMTPDIYYGTYRRPAGSPDAAAPLVRVGGLSDCVSVFGATDRFDANTAQPALLAAVGVPPDVVGALLARRRTQPFNNDQELAAFLAGAGPAIARLRAGGNSIYTLRATARLRMPNGQLSDLRRTVAAMVKFMPPGYDSQFHILRWYDTAWGQS